VLVLCFTAVRLEARPTIPLGTTANVALAVWSSVLSMT
jgi:hypothetical protein